MATNYQFFCIFKSSVSNNVTNNIEQVKTLTGCNCHGYCSKHYSTLEGLKTIQDECRGHRLTNSNKQSTIIPIITSGNNITHTQYNLLAEIINTELNDRRKSPQYAKVEKFYTTTPSVQSKQHITKQQITKLNNFIVKQQNFYKDEAKVPTDLDTIASEIKSIDINKTIAAVKNLLNDCICYADCNGYAGCTCYGNCNYY